MLTVLKRKGLVVSREEEKEEGKDMTRE